MKKKVHIYVFRHGQTTFNRDAKFTGWTDAKLTPLGIKQAKVVAKKLKNNNICIAIHNGLSRSSDTLKEVLKYHPECVQIIKDKRMIERSYGKLSGKSHDVVIKKFGIEQYNKWHRDFYVRAAKGESFADVEKRVRSFITDLMKLVKKCKVNVAISASGNSIRLFRKIMEKATVAEAVEWFIPYDRVYDYTVDV